jgi:hypothetical protein
MAPPCERMMSPWLASCARSLRTVAVDTPSASASSPTETAESAPASCRMLRSRSTRYRGRARSGCRGRAISSAMASMLPNRRLLFRYLLCRLTPPSRLTPSSLGRPRTPTCGGRDCRTALVKPLTPLRDLVYAHAKLIITTQLCSSSTLMTSRSLIVRHGQRLNRMTAEQQTPRAR